MLSVDNDPAIQPATAPNTRFVLADIMQASFLTMLRQQLQLALAAAATGTGTATPAGSPVGAMADGPWCVVLGVHLCGPLSPRAIELFETCRELDAIILVPCYLDPRTDGELKASARAAGLDPYEAKVDQLVQILRGTADSDDASDSSVASIVRSDGAQLDVKVVRDMAMRTNKGGATSEGAKYCKNAVITGVRRRFASDHLCKRRRDCELH